MGMANAIPTKGSTDVGNDATTAPNLPLLSPVPFLSSPHRPFAGACELDAHCRLVFGVGYHMVHQGQMWFLAPFFFCGQRHYSKLFSAVGATDLFNFRHHRYTAE